MPQVKSFPNISLNMLSSPTLLINGSILVSFVIVAIVSLYKYSCRNYDYWKKRGVFNPKPLPFIGNLKEALTLRAIAMEWLKYLYDTNEEKYFGIYIFDKPGLVVRDPVLIKDILIKDFDKFHDRSVLSPPHDEIMKEMIFFQKNPNWKLIRAKVSPIFTSAKLKNMIPAMKETSRNFALYLSDYVGDVDDIKPHATRYALEAVSEFIFDIRSEWFVKEHPEFHQMGEKLFEVSLSNTIAQCLFFFKPDWARILKLHFVNQKVLGYFADMFMRTLEMRENHPRLNDLIDIINDLKKDKEFCKQTGLKGKSIASPALQLFVAGFETNTSLLSFLLYEMCKNRNIQTKLRDEITSSLEQYGELHYEALSNMKYLSKVVKEVTRKYPTLPFLDRVCNTDYKLRDTDLVIEKGTTIYLSPYHFHHDEKYFKDPYEFIPERYEDTNKNLNTDGLFFLPFGAGPRSCLGERFALLSTKIFLCTVILNYEFIPNARTPTTIRYVPESLFLRSDGGLPMTIRKLHLDIKSC